MVPRSREPLRTGEDVTGLAFAGIALTLMLLFAARDHEHTRERMRVRYVADEQRRRREACKPDS
jgi:hypothetical protein